MRCVSRNFLHSRLSPISSETRESMCCFEAIGHHHRVLIHRVIITFFLRSMRNTYSLFQRGVMILYGFEGQWFAYSHCCFSSPVIFAFGRWPFTYLTRHRPTNYLESKLSLEVGAHLVTYVSLAFTARDGCKRNMWIEDYIRIQTSSQYSPITSPRVRGVRKYPQPRHNRGRGACDEGKCCLQISIWAFQQESEMRWSVQENLVENVH